MLRSRACTCHLVVGCGVNGQWFIQLLFLRCVLLLVQKIFGEDDSHCACPRFSVVRWKALGTPVLSAAGRCVVVQVAAHGRCVLVCAVRSTPSSTKTYLPFKN